MTRENLNQEKYEESYPIREGHKIIGYTTDMDFELIWEEMKKVFKKGNRYYYTYKDMSSEAGVELIGFQY